MKKLLIIEDDKVDQIAFERFVKSNTFPFDYELVESVRDAIKAIETKSYDIIITDYFLGDGTAFEILNAHPDTPIIVVTGTGSEEVAVDSLKRGAFDYLIKDIDGHYLKMLPVTIENTLSRYNAQKELEMYRKDLEKQVKLRTTEFEKELKLRNKIENHLKKLSVAVEQSPSIIIITDINGIIEYVNPKCTKVTGYSNKQMTGRDVNFLSADKNYIQNTLWDQLKKKQVWSGEFLNQKKNGETFIEEATISPILNADGEITHYVKVAEDVTQKNRFQTIQQIIYHISSAVATTSSLEELVDFTKNELSQILNTSNFYIGFYDKNTNRFHAPIFADENDDFSSWDATGSLSGLVVNRAESMILDEAEINELMEKGEIKQFGHMPKIWMGVPLIHNGEAKGIFALQNYDNKNVFSNDDLEILEFVASQISHSLVNKQMEQSLKESEKRFKQLFGSLGDAVFVTKIGDESRGQILEVNRAAVKQTGYSREELLQMNIIEDLLVSDSNEISTLEWEKRILNGEVFTSVEKKKRKNGKTYWDEVIVTLFDLENGKAALSINRDITKRIKTEKKLQKALKKATESDRLKSAFLANMSHEIRTPMNGMLGFTELLKSPELTAETQLKYIQIIEKSGNRMLDTINDIIDISRIESGQIELHKQNFSLNEQLQYFDVFFKPEANKKDILFKVKNTNASSDIRLNTDKEKFNAVLSNLIKNAIKYTKKGNIEVGYKVKKTNLEFYVKDTGIGIPERRQEAIFERFMQADIEDRGAYEGSGLGLAISKAYVDLMGGKIKVKSKKDKGSVFYFTLPNSNVPDNTIKTDNNKSTEPGNINKINLLIADDDDVSILFLKTILTKVIDKLYTASTGVQAVEICKQNPEIELVLMDAKMPEMDGNQATQEIRTFNKDVVIIAQTANALLGDEKKALGSGSNGYLSKPIKKEELLQLIGKYFGKH